jgi:predicted outer membrane repeat protein
MGSEKPRLHRKGDAIRHAASVTVLVLSLVAVAGGEDKQSDRGRYVPGEIIIRLHGSRVVSSGGNDSNEAGIISRLLAGKDVAGTGWRVRAVRPIAGRAAQHVGTRSAESRLRRSIREKRRQEGSAAPDPSRVYRVSLSNEGQGGLDAVLRAYRKMPEVEYAELNPIVSACATPNDPLFSSQWAIAKIQASAAWDTCAGTVTPIVAIIDSGADLNHRDLRSNLWVNEAELNGAAGVDDDENGYVDDLYGYNFVYRTDDPQDDNGHGTHVAGIVAAAGNNGADISGVCWRARIMPLKILDSDGNGDAAAAAAAIYYAVANGADVINASWGGPDSGRVLSDAIAYAERQGVVVVAAAGNDGTETPFYPAYYSTVIAVAATDRTDRRPSFSNYGSWVDVAAPGWDILSLRAAGTSEGTLEDEFTTSLSGTSVAAPHVTGTCALLLAANPFLTCAQIRQIITTSGDSISTGITSSNQRVNVAGAMRQVVSGKGVVYFDRSAYSLGSDVGILLVDSDLAGKATQAVTLQTSGGDAESLVLSQTTWAKGVFAGTIVSRDTAVVPADGCVELRDGEEVTVRYTDADDGLGHTGLKVSADARADYEPATVVSTEVGIRDSAVRLAIVTSESTQVEVRYHRRDNASAVWIARSDELTDHHEIFLSPLPRTTDYRFVIHVTDAAGNQSTDANSGNEYAFSTAAESVDLRVPSVYRTIQDAIDAAWIGDTIRVADGTYRGAGNTDLDFGGKALTLCSENGPAACLIDCRGQGSGFYFHSGEDSHCVVDGFTITNAGKVDTGGGILCVASSPTIRNCIFLANEADYYGAAICNQYGSSPAISQCTFKNNATSPVGIDTRGGAIANRFGSNPIVSDCTFTGNSAGESGGAIANTDDSRPQILRCVFQGNLARVEGGAVANLGQSHPVLAQCTFTGNSALSSGGAVYCQTGTEPHFEHCLFTGNVADRLGGAVANDGAVVALTNCTLADNRSQWYGGGLWNGAASVGDIEDSILWGNTDGYSGPQTENAQIIRDNARVTVNYTCVQGLSASLPGVSNIGSDPLFADPQNEDYHLKSQAGRAVVVETQGSASLQWVTDAVTSPCIDAGNPDRPLGDEPLSTPLDPTNAWSINRHINMGVYGGTAEASMAPLP